MIFDDISYIKPNVELQKGFTKRNYAPMFRKTFNVDNVDTANLFFCGLGFGYCYINGVPVSDNLFTAPVSNYSKTIWYNSYDVTDMLKPGKNVIAVWCGNGFFNEDFRSSWNFDEAEWRDVPKFILKLEVNDLTIVKSDDSWKCNKETAIWFNALRSGEYFDARKFDESWNTLEYDDSEWENAIVDTAPPKGIFRKCNCEPIKEFESYNTKKVIKVCDGKYIFDLGQNISGYIRLKITGESGQRLTIRYAEQIREDLSLELNEMTQHYPESEVQTDVFICSGKSFEWSPKFTYHGFRYIEIEGLNLAEEAEVKGVFVHQDVEKRTEFECSDEFINNLFKAGQYSVYSNMFYCMTDCPTREKLGWANDAQSSAEQILTNFRAEKFFEKWLKDIYDAMRDDGALPGIIPTAGWGYHWGNGPVSDGVLFELPYRIYMHTGNAESLVESIKYFDRYFKYIRNKTDSDGFVRFGLPDWAAFNYNEEHPQVPMEFINALLIRNFYNIAELASTLVCNEGKGYKKYAEEQEKLILNTYINSDGTCKINEQTAVCMLIYYDVYKELSPLKEQLKKLIEENDFRHDCGMVGLRRLFIALNKCNLEEYAYKIITGHGLPSFREWFEQGAVTLWEFWDWRRRCDSKNHHMYSDFMSWIVKTILGIKQITPGFGSVCIEPYFFKELDFARGMCKTNGGDVSVSWKRQGENIRVEINVPNGMKAMYKEHLLCVGENVFIESAK